jgi:hypothetical protein
MVTKMKLIRRLNSYKAAFKRDMGLDANKNKTLYMLYVMARLQDDQFHLEIKMQKQLKALTDTLAGTTWLHEPSDDEEENPANN